VSALARPRSSSNILNTSIYTDTGEREQNISIRPFDTSSLSEMV
jgi:hypothetical protein